ncbi:MAG: hypothetical protein Q9167_007246 [Letrouitia subvulpina]
MAASSSSKTSPLKQEEVEEELFADSEVVPTRSGGSWRIDLPDFLRGITRPKVTRAGHPPKRRGPKPDSKPALTRRQELNRMAQRTHRERKDCYAKDLEWRVIRMREEYIELVQTKEAYRAENEEMANLLRAHGIPFQSQIEQSQIQGPSFYGSSPFGSGSGVSSSRPQTLETSPSGTTLSPRSPSGLAIMSPGAPNGFAISPDVKKPSPNQSMKNLTIQDRKLNFDQEALNLILTLEKFCHEHKVPMCHRGRNDNPVELSGHALMATCPTQKHLDEESPDTTYHALPDVPIPELWKLLDLAQELPLRGELTPVHVVKMLKDHERFEELTEKDFSDLTKILCEITRCYGFGAVLFEYEVRDRIAELFAKKDLVSPAQHANAFNGAGSWGQFDFTQPAHRY